MVELGSVVDDCLADCLEIFDLLISYLAEQLPKTFIKLFLLIAVVSAIGAKLHQDLII